MENPTDTTDTHHIPDAHSFARWVRAVDRLLWQERAAALTADDISPRDARLLHVLSSDHASTLAHLSHGGKRLRRLAERGWVTEADGTWSLTDAGRASADRLAQRADDLGSRLSAAVSADELAAASTTLEAVARALGWQEGESREGRHPHHPRGFDPRGHRFGHGRHGFGPGAHGFGPRERVHGGRDRHGDDVVDRDSRRGDTESAYERGFAAGFSQGRTAASA